MLRRTNLEEAAGVLNLDRLVLIIGDRFHLHHHRSSGRLGLRSELAAKLSQSLSERQSISQSFCQVAQSFEALYGRQALISAINSGHLPVHDNPFQSLDRVNFQSIISLDFGPFIPATFANSKVRVVVDDVELQYVEDRAAYMAFGSLSHPLSLKLTLEDLRRMRQQRSLIWATMQAQCLLFQPVLIGVDLSELSMQDLVADLLFHQDRHQRALLFAGCTVPDEFEDRAGQQHGFIVDDHPADIIQGLVSIGVRRRINARHRRPKRGHQSDGVNGPLKLLNSYEREDSKTFFGRDRDIREASMAVVNSHLTIIFGDSGVGKTSLVQAGLIPSLLERFGRGGVGAVFTIRPWEDPNQEFSKVIAPFSANGRTKEHILAPKEIGPIVFVDQAEELFTNPAIHPESRRSFFDSIINHANVTSTLVRVVLVVRSDFLGSVLNALSGIGQENRSLFGVKPLEFSGFTSVCNNVLAYFNMSMTEAGQRRFYNELSRGADSIFPPHLQLGLSAVVEYLRSVGEFKIDSTHFDSAVDIRAALTTYVHNTISGFPEADQLLTREILSCLVTPDKTKRPITMDHLRLRATRRCQAVASFEQVIARLLEARILRHVTGSGGQVYVELTHDYIIELVAGWVGESSLAMQLAQEYADQEHNNYKIRSDISMQKSRFDAINIARDDITTTPDQDVFLLLCALEFFKDIPYWFDRAARHSISQERLINHFDRSSGRTMLSLGILLLARYSEAINVDEIYRSLSGICNPHGVSLARQLHARDCIQKQVDHFSSVRFREMTVEIPEGHFSMGSTEEDTRAIADEFEIPLSWIKKERPQCKIYLPTFRIDRFPVTNALFAEFDASHTYLIEEADHPVVNVNWFTARKFASWCGKNLPNEAQWEKAARGLDGRRYPWGNVYQIGEALANCEDEGIGHTTPVGSFSKGVSPFGCYDMAGNVFEWTSSKAAPYPFDEADGREAPEFDGTKRILRGGAWSYNHTLMRCSLRYDYYTPQRLANSVGFRCVCMA